MNKTERAKFSDDIRKKLAFQRGVLTILKETDLFGPMIEKALEEIDEVIDKVG